MALINKLSALADSIRAKTGSTEKLTLDQMATAITEIETTPEMIVLVDDAGHEVAAVLTDEAITLTATPNDVRAGTTAIMSTGLGEGSKEIPTYRTTEGWAAILSGKTIAVKIRDGKYDYTKLQALICAFNTNVNDSVSTEKVVINDNVYAVNSTESLSVVVIDHENESINLGITNESDKPCVFRYFTYKEDY